MNFAGVCVCWVGVVTRETFFGGAEMFSRGPYGHQGTHPQNWRHFVHSEALAGYRASLFRRAGLLGVDHHVEGSWMTAMRRGNYFIN